MHNKQNCFLTSVIGIEWFFLSGYLSLVFLEKPPTSFTNYLALMRISILRGMFSVCLKNILVYIIRLSHTQLEISLANNIRANKPHSVHGMEHIITLWEWTNCCQKLEPIISTTPPIVSFHAADHWIGYLDRVVYFP